MKADVALIKQESMKKVVQFPLLLEEQIKIDEILMRVDVYKENDKEELYQIFCEPNSKNNENSRIQFLSIGNFPDYCFFKYDEITDSVDCYICELKKKPTNKLKQLKAQLLAGYLHCKVLLSLLSIEKINYFFTVYYIDDGNKELLYNKIPGALRKVTPGREVTQPNDYDEWLNDKLTYINDGYVFEMDLIKHKLDKCSDDLYHKDHII